MYNCSRLGSILRIWLDKNTSTNIEINYCNSQSLISYTLHQQDVMTVKRITKVDRIQTSSEEYGNAFVTNSLGDIFKMSIDQKYLDSMSRGEYFRLSSHTVNHTLGGTITTKNANFTSIFLCRVTVIWCRPETKNIKTSNDLKCILLEYIFFSICEIWTQVYYITNLHLFYEI